MTTITMPKNDARKLFLEYRHAVRERHDAEDKAIMKGYKALSSGRPVIHLLDVMKEAGADEQGRPRFAVARADQKRVQMWRRTDGSVAFQCSRSNSRSLNVVFPAETLPPPSWYQQATAIIPNIPPHIRPGGKLARFHILWEADWEAAPRDPVLLRHAGGWLYVVLATWDLTPLERAVIGLTRAVRR